MSSESRKKGGASRFAATQAEILAAFGKTLDRDLPKLVKVLGDCKGVVLTIGIGKSEAIAGRMALVWRSAGLRAHFMRLNDMFYGASWPVGAGDVAVLVSGGGEEREFLNVLPWLKRSGATIVSIAPSARSSVGRGSDLAIGAGQSGDPSAESPSTSLCLCAVLLGDAAARELGVRAAGKRIAANSPAGGKRDAVTVDDVLAIRNQNPVAPGRTIFRDALMEMTQKGLGALAVADEKGRLAGILTDGDVRRLLQKAQGSLARLFLMRLDQVMTKNPTSISGSRSVTEAIEQMEDRAITVLPVVSRSGKPVGMIHLHDLVKLRLMGAGEMER